MERRCRGCYQKMEWVHAHANCLKCARCCECVDPKFINVNSRDFAQLENIVAKAIKRSLEDQPSPQA
jgi:hypothetical protein